MQGALKRQRGARALAATFGLKTTSSVARSAFSFFPGMSLGPYAAASTQVLSAGHGTPQKAKQEE